MKFLDIPKLALLTAYLSSREVGDAILSARLEAFSCKAAGEDKKLGKVLEKQYKEEAKAEPTSPIITATPLGDLTAPATRRLLINLIATLNASFPDYDFKSTKPDEFLRVYDYRIAVSKVNKHLAEIIQADGTSIVDNLWGAINEAITLAECQVYTYIPNLDSDPFSEDTLWSFNFFFVNPTQKKILYFTCLAHSKAHAARSDDSGDSDDSSEAEIELTPPDSADNTRPVSASRVLGGNEDVRVRPRDRAASLVDVAASESDSDDTGLSIHSDGDDDDNEQTAAA